MAVINKNGTYMALPSAIKRGSATALDTTSVWYDRALMEFYAQGGGKFGEIDVPITAYVGQVLTLVDETNNTATAYIIADVAGNLNEVGSSTLGDNISIELVDGKLSIKDFGRKYYKYVAAVEGGEAAHYELTEGWIDNLEPRVTQVGEDFVIGWYQPNPTTADKVADEVIEVREDVNALDEILNGTEENPGGLVGEVADITEALYGTEGETPVPGLIEDVEELGNEIDVITKDLADNYYTKLDTYNRTEIDGLVSGVFHFEGTAESYETLPTTGNVKGDVYQVDDKEYAWNGKAWVELGYVVDLSGYYTKTEIDTEVKKVQDALDLVEEDVTELVNADTAINERIDELEQAHETINSAIDAVEEDVASLVTEDERLAGLISGHEDRIADLETAKTEFDTHFETVDGKIAALETADQGFETRIGTLEGYVGTPTKNLGALYPVVESLSDRFNSFEETLEGQGFGEFNKLETLTINGALLTPNETKNIDLPIFAGSTSGLVPVVNDLDNTYYLNAAGEWTIPQDARIGNLGDFGTVTEYVDNAISEAFTWSTIVE